MKYPVINSCAKFVWSKKGNPFETFIHDHAEKFVDAPIDLTDGEMNFTYTSLFKVDKIIIIINI